MQGCHINNSTTILNIIENRCMFVVGIIPWLLGDFCEEKKEMTFLSFSI